MKTLVPNTTAIEALGTPEQRQTWIEGLRSGKYEQEQHRMCNPDKENSACCLHVAMIEVDNRRWEEALDETNVGSYGTPNSVEMNLNKTSIEANDKRQVEFFSAKARHTYIATKEDEDHNINPASLNDHYNLSFLQIADLLEGKSVEYDENNLTGAV